MGHYAVKMNAIHDAELGNQAVVAGTPGPSPMMCT